MVRGFLISIAAMAMIAFIFYGALILLSSSIFGIVNKSEITMQMGSYSMNYALDAAEIYLRDSVKYSFCQGIYDNFQKAGWSEKKEGIYVRIGNKEYFFLPEKKEIEEQLIAKIKQNMGVYTLKSFNFGDHHIDLPNGDIGLKNDKISFEPSNKIELTDNIENPDETVVQMRIAKTPSIEIETGIDYGQMIDIAINCQDSIKNNAKNIITSELESLPKTLERQGAEGSPTCESLFEEETGKSTGEIITSIKEKLEKIGCAQGKEGYTISSEPVSTDFKITSSTESRVEDKESGKTDIICEYKYEPYVLYSNRITDDTGECVVMVNGNIQREKISLYFATTFSKENM